MPFGALKRKQAGQGLRFALAISTAHVTISGTMRIAFIYNIATDELLREQAEMTLSDCDSLDTIHEVTAALESGGHTVIGLNADQQLPARLVELRDQIDIVFNIATGVYGETRQSHVPAMLEYLRIPHTGAGVLAEAICHHKPQTKMILAANGIPTALFQLFRTAADPLRPDLRFPLIVKLPSEGGSLGLSYASVVEDEPALRRQVAAIIDRYHEGALVESYLPGREFTIAVLGNDPPYALPIAELHFFGAKPIRLDEPDVPTFEQYKQAVGQEMPYIPMESKSSAPADLPLAETERLQKLAIAAYQALVCKDWARFDLRLDAAGQPHILEANLEPGVASDYVLAKCARAAGWTFQETILRILGHAIDRYPHLRSPKP